jgi:hypothetical protein
MRRNVRKLVKDRDWAERRLERETNPAVRVELLEIVADMERIGSAKLRGIRYQESRLPKSDGPADCLDCQISIGTPVPVACQRKFEEGLSVTGLTPEAVWGMPEYRTPRSLIGKGRGQVVISRARHADHIDSYREWKATRGGGPN